MNSRLLPEHVHRHIDSLAAIIAPEIPRHFSRWGPGCFYLAAPHRTNEGLCRAPGLRLMKTAYPTAVRTNAYYPLTIANEAPAAGYVHLNT